MSKADVNNKQALICLYFLSFYIFFNKESLNVINFEGKEERALGNKYRLSVSSPSS